MAFDIEAHRGGRALFPENTLAAFANALSMGVDTLELDTAGRLAKKLLALARDHGWSDPDRSVIDIGLTQHDLARMLGVSRESVNKQLAWFRARGIIQVERGRVAEALGIILDQYTVIDMSVQDPPLDQVIARVFEEGHARHEADGQHE